jgi:hypothetical protein
MAGWPMRVRPRVRWLCALLVLAALAQPTAATAQQPDTGATDSSDPAPAEPFRVTIDAPAKGSPIAPSGDISFSANKPGAAFTCQLGAAARGSCTSPVHYGPLPPGQQLPFAVFALLPGAHSSSADRTVYTIAQVETTPLEVTITSAPSGEVNEKAATISFTANRSEAAFRCTLDGVAAPCSSPRQYRDLSAGTHAFTVVAVAGNETSKAKSASWTVAAVGPPSQGPPQAGTTSAPEGTSPETSPPPSATDGGSNWLVVVALVVLGALVAAMLLELLRRMARARRRATW